MTILSLVLANISNSKTSNLSGCTRPELHFPTWKACYLDPCPWIPSLQVCSACTARSVGCASALSSLPCSLGSASPAASQSHSDFHFQLQKRQTIHRQNVKPGSQVPPFAGPGPQFSKPESSSGTQAEFQVSLHQNALLNWGQNGPTSTHGQQFQALHWICKISVLPICQRAPVSPCISAPARWQSIGTQNFTSHSNPV